LRHPEEARTKTAAAAKLPAWALKEANLGRGKVELMLQDSMTRDRYNEPWRCVSQYGMLPIGNIQ
jgi:hypothetical protein